MIRRFSDARRRDLFDYITSQTNDNTDNDEDDGRLLRGAERHQDGLRRGNQEGVSGKKVIKKLYELIKSSFVVTDIASWP